jgi:TonB-linked SusC/RagA family outer membrane protein
MRRIVTSLASSAFLVLFAFQGGVLAQAADDGGVSHGPRFLFAASERAVPIPIDISRTPALHQRLELDLDGVSAKEALATIARQSGIRIFYMDNLLAGAPPVRLRAEGITVAAALTDVLAGVNVDVVFSRDGAATLVKRQQTAALARMGTLTGTVTDADTHEPVASVAIVVENTRLGAMTDTDGRYRLANVPPGTYTVSARRIGYSKATQSVTVPASGEVTVDFALQKSASVLDATVVTATGTARTRELGNSVGTIDSAVVARAPVSTPQQLLAGRTPGVTVLANSGQPGAGGTIRLRGNNSVSQGNDPIIYVDGVRIYNGAMATNTVSRQAASPFNDIDPADIDHVEIVRGPAATTLYGTEASGGVIQIFTKRGATGAPQWSASASAGFNNMGHLGPSDDPTGLFVNECRGPDLVASDGTRFEDPTCPASGSWLRNGPVQRYSLDVRGGTEDMKYFLSGNFIDEDGVISPGGNKNGGLRGNFSFRPGKHIEFSLNSAYDKRHIDWVPDGDLGNGLLLNVSRGPYGNFKGDGCSDPDAVCVDNGAILTATGTTAADHYTTGLVITYDPTEHFNNRLAVGYDYNASRNTSFVPFGFPRTPLGYLARYDWHRELLSIDYAGTYRKPIGTSITTSTSVGGQLFDMRHQYTALQGNNFPGPVDPTLISGSLREISSDENDRVINAGFFAQEVLGWRDRLFVTGGLRVDGNSAFGQSFGLQPYPKVSASYVISDESFWPSNIIETMKLRAALGESGKAPGAFDAERTWSPAAAQNGQPAFIPDQIGNPNLGPERTRETEVGFDATSLNGRLGLTFTYYRQHTFDALIPMVFPPSEGFSARQLENVGELMNHGIELSADAELVRHDNFDWHVRLNYSTINSKAGNLGGQIVTIGTSSDQYVREGYPVPSYIGKKVMNPNEIADPVIADDQFLGAVFPNKILSPSTTITLMRRLTLDALGEFQLGGSLMNATGYQNAYKGVWRPCYAIQTKLRAAAAGDATALDDVTAMQRARCTLDGGLRSYDFWVEPADFFKLRSVTLTYDIPQRLLHGLRSASIAVSGVNLFTSTKYSGTDPEVKDTSDNAYGRWDYYNLPSYRTFLATLRVNF